MTGASSTPRWNTRHGHHQNRLMKSSTRILALASSKAEAHQIRRIPRLLYKLSGTLRSSESGSYAMSVLSLRMDSRPSGNATALYDPASLTVGCVFDASSAKRKLPNKLLAI